MAFSHFAEKTLISTSNFFGKIKPNSLFIMHKSYHPQKNLKSSQRHSAKSYHPFIFSLIILVSDEYTLYFYQISLLSIPNTNFSSRITADYIKISLKIKVKQNQMKKKVI